MDESEADVLACMAFPAQPSPKLHRTKLPSNQAAQQPSCTAASCPAPGCPAPTRCTNPLERLNKEVKRRADVAGTFPDEDSILRLIGAVLFEQNDDWQSQHRFKMVEPFSQIDTARIDTAQRHRPETPPGSTRLQA